MVSKEVKEVIASGISLLAYDPGLTTSEKEERCATLLVLCAELLNIKASLQEDKIKATSLSAAIYATEQAKFLTVKSANEKKALAEAEPAYISAREQEETVDADLKYINAIYDVFNNGHIMWRQYSRPL